VLARRLRLHLSEHGGTGQGVVGALAGVGLRLSGRDGRVRGGLQISGASGRASAGQIRAHPHVDEVMTLEGQVLADDEQVLLGEKVKAVMQDGKCVVLVTASESNEAPWKTCPKELLKRY